MHKNAKLPIAVTALLSVAFAVGFHLFLTALEATTDYFWEENLQDDPLWRRIVAVFSALLIPVSFRVLFGLALTSKPTREHLNGCDQGALPLSKRLKATVTDSYFYLWLLPTLLSTFIVSPAFGYAPISAAIYGDQLPDLFTQRLTVLAILLPLYPLLAIEAFGKARKRLQEEKALDAPTLRKMKEKRIPQNAALIISLIGVATVGPFILMLLVTLWNFSAAFFPIILGVILFLYATRLLRAIHIRQKLIRELRSRHETRRIRLGELKHPYLSLVFSRLSTPFTLHANGKTYTCRLIASANRKKHIYFNDDGTGYFIRRYRLPLFMPVVHSRKGARVVDVRDQGELFHTKTAFRYGFEATGTKLLIVCPMPQELRAKRGEDLTLLTPGDSIGGYKIYNTNTFFSHLDLNLLDS